MCGIFGIVDPQTRPLDAAQWAAVHRASRSRGPDDFGAHGFDDADERHWPTLPTETTAATCTFAHWRLSILDLSPAGHQPMDDALGRWSIVYNGEIYNYLELRDELAGLGHRFRSGSDTEVLLTAWATWGAACVDRLIGMYAFAIWDREARELWLARDPQGIKPLYVAAHDGRFVFGSLPGMLQTPAGLPQRADAQRLYEYVAYNAVDHTPGTFFAGVQRFPAGAVGRVGLDAGARLQITRRYELPAAATFTGSEDDAAAELRALFLDSVRLHLRSDVPLGAALSGGIDSSSIVMAMRHLLGPEAEVHAVAYVADDPRLSEERWIQEVIRASDVQLHRVEMQPEDLLEDLDPLIAAQQEPFSSTSIYAQYRVFRTAAESGLRVMLDGQGADELLAGYEGLHPYHLAGLLRRGRPDLALRFLCRRHARTDLRTILHTLRQTFGLNINGRRPPGHHWMRRDWLHERSVDTAFSRGLLGARSLHEALELLFNYRGLPALLRYDDHNSMAHSVESRVPFLTPQLVAFLRSMPESFLIDDTGTSKAIFRRAMRGLVPDSILDRRDKIGFATPEQAWLPHLLPETIASLRAEPQRWPFLDVDRATDFLDGIVAGQRCYDPVAWRLTCVVRWMDIFGLDC